MTVTAGLLVVGHVDERARHIAGDYPELFADLLAPFDVRVVPYAVDDGELPQSLRECDGWLCSPSRLSVYDKVPWIADVEAIIRTAVHDDHPFVGICFGHQLLAQALGGRVERASRGWGVGVQLYEVVDHVLGMQPRLERCALIASHEDQVVEVPHGVRVIARADYCPVAGLAAGDRVWTLQAHPEFTAALAEHLLALRVNLIGPERVQQARASLARPLDRAAVAAWIAATLGASP
jgi:GMP synthase-like glutamine amidotransferase